MSDLWIVTPWSLDSLMYDLGGQEILDTINEWRHKLNALKKDIFVNPNTPELVIHELHKFPLVNVRTSECVPLGQVYVMKPFCIADEFDFLS